MSRGPHCVNMSFPLVGNESTFAGTHALDKPPRPHSGGRTLSVSQSQGLHIQGVTLIWYGQLHSPLESTTLSLFAL